MENGKSGRFRTGLLRARQENGAKSARGTLRGRGGCNLPRNPGRSYRGVLLMDNFAMDLTHQIALKLAMKEKYLGRIVFYFWIILFLTMIIVFCCLALIVTIVVYPIVTEVSRRMPDSRLGAIRGLTFDGLRIATDSGILLQGDPRSPIRDLHLCNVRMRIQRDFDFVRRHLRIGRTLR